MRRDRREKTWFIPGRGRRDDSSWCGDDFASVNHLLFLVFDFSKGADIQGIVGTVH